MYAEANKNIRLAQASPYPDPLSQSFLDNRINPEKYSKSMNDTLVKLYEKNEKEMKEIEVLIKEMSTLNVANASILAMPIAKKIVTKGTAIGIALTFMQMSYLIDTIIEDIAVRKLVKEKIKEAYKNPNIKGEYKDKPKGGKDKDPENNPNNNPDSVPQPGPIPDDDPVNDKKCQVLKDNNEDAKQNLSKKIDEVLYKLEKNTNTATRKTIMYNLLKDMYPYTPVIFKKDGSNKLKHTSIIKGILLEKYSLAIKNNQRKRSRSIISLLYLLTDESFGKYISKEDCENDKKYRVSRFSNEFSNIFFNINDNYGEGPNHILHHIDLPDQNKKIDSIYLVNKFKEKHEIYTKSEQSKKYNIYTLTHVTDKNLLFNVSLQIYMNSDLNEHRFNYTSDMPYYIMRITPSNKNHTTTEKQAIDVTVYMQGVGIRTIYIK